MAGSERVLVVTSDHAQAGRLESTMAHMRAGNTIPVVFVVQAVSEALPGADVEAASVQALSRIIDEGQLEAVVVLADDEERGVATSRIVRRVAADAGIPLWQVIDGPAEKRDRVVGEHVFRSVPVRVPADVGRRGFGYWFATLGTGVLAVAVTVAGTFSYLAAPPIGLALAALGVWGTLVGARLMHPYRAPGVVAAVVSLVTLLVLATDPFGGVQGSASILIPSTALGWTWIGVVAIGSFATLAVPDLRGARVDRLDVREGAVP